MPSTTNFGWTTPADTDLVKDGAAAIRTLGNGIDTSLVDLKGGTTGQNLRKATNTDLDFTWAGDATNTVVDAAGDLLYGTAADTLGRLAIGTANQVLAVNSGATAPEWKTISTGGMTELASGTLSSTAVTLSSISQSYKNLQLVIRAPRLNTTGTRLALRWNGATANYHYNWRDDITLSNGSFADRFWASVSDLPTSANTWHFCYDFLDYTNANRYLINGVGNEGSTGTQSYWANNTSTPAAITEIIITTQNGTSTFNSGTYILYGVA